MSHEPTEQLHVKFQDNSLADRMREGLDKYFILKLAKESDVTIINYYNQQDALVAMGAYPLNARLFKAMHLDTFFAPPAISYNRLTDELTFNLRDKDFYTQLLKFENHISQLVLTQNATQNVPRTQIGQYSSTTDRIADFPDERHRR